MSECKHEFVILNNKHMSCRLCAVNAIAHIAELEAKLERQEAYYMGDREHIAEQAAEIKAMADVLNTLNPHRRIAEQAAELAKLKASTGLECDWVEIDGVRTYTSYNARLREAAQAVKDDLKLRAEDGVVAIGNGAWFKLCKALEVDSNATE